MVWQFLCEKWQCGKLYAVKLFQEMAAPPKTTYTIVNECCEGCPMQRKSESGQTAQKMTKIKMRAELGYL